MSRSRMREFVWAAAAVMICGLASCSDDDPQPQQLDQGVAVDVGTTSDLPPDPDKGSQPDLNPNIKCYTEWRSAISPQGSVTKGTVTTTQTSGVYTAQIDATAGGSVSGANNYPYIYISLKDGKRVDIDDFKAKNDTSWDIAFRRTVILINGGDSGAGKAAVSAVTATDLSQVTTIPAANTFVTDDYLDDKCVLVMDISGQYPATAIGGTKGWYKTESDAGMMPSFEPRDLVYVLKLANGTDHVKLKIVTYYDQSTKTSAWFTIKWSTIK
jgi:hypothetical protein